MKGRAAVGLVGVVGCLLLTAGVAAADRCHTPLPGTRLFTLSADVTGYRFSGGRIVVNWARSAACAGTAVWAYTVEARVNARLACQRPTRLSAAATVTKFVASDATRTVEVVPARVAADLPARLVVRDRASGRTVASWPLPEQSARVALYGGIAILSGATRHALYALRIADGRGAQIGIARAGDRPLIGPAGVLYQDDLDLIKHRTAPTERTLKLLPLGTVRQELARPFSTVRKYMSYSTLPKPTAAAATTDTRVVAAPNGPLYRGADPPRPFRSHSITAISMDGPRVALAVRDPTGRCDSVLFWNVAWHYVTRLTRASGQTCLPGHAAGGITDVAIAGSRAIWTVTYGGKTRVLAAAITDCQEWTVARPLAGQHVALAGDGGILAYALASPQGAQPVASEVGVVPSFWRGDLIEQIQNRLLALSVYNEQVAALGADGTVSITTGSGERVARLQTESARTIALGGNVLAALRSGGTLDVYSVKNGLRLHSWKVATTATSVDMQYGIALVTAGHNVYAINTATGRTTRIFHGRGRVAAQLEAPGAAIASSVAGHGHLEFVPMSQIEARTR